MGVFKKLSTKLHAHTAAASHRWPAKRLQVVMVGGADGGTLTCVALASILRTQGAKVGVVTSQFVEIAGERAQGSDQANVLGDAFRMQGLLAQMRRAGCEVVIIEVPAQLPEHSFAGVQPAMVVMRRCGDSHFNQAANTSREALWRKLTAMRPNLVVLNRDDPCYVAMQGMPETSTMTFGTHDKAECRVTGVEVHPKGSAISLLVDHQTELRLATELSGKTAIYSVVAAAAAAYLLHVPIAVIEDGVAAVEAQPSALQYLPASRPYSIVLDGNVTPDGLAETLETAKHFTKNRLIIVASAVLGQAPELRPQIGELAAQFGDRIIVTDGEYTAEESPQTVREQILQGVAALNADARTEEVGERAEALEKALSIARRGDTILVISSVQRPYRQIGRERQHWSDAAKIEEFLS